MAVHPLSTGQEALWFLHRMRPTGTEYTGAASVHVHSEMDAVLLEAALSVTTKRHAMLRSTFEDGPSGPVRRVHPDRGPLLEWRDAIGAEDDELGALTESLAAVPFDLQADVPFRFLAIRTRRRAGGEREGAKESGPAGGGDAAEAGRTVIVVVAHHIAMDLTSEMLVLEELLHHYGSMQQGCTVELPKAGDYDDFVAQERTGLTPAARARSEAFWRTYCTPLPEDFEFPADRPRPTVLTAASASLRIPLRREFSDQLDEAARSLGVTPFVYLFSVFQLLLYQRTQRADFLIGYTASCRFRSKTRNTVGYLINTPPHRVALHSGMPFRQVVEKTDHDMRRAVGHTGYPFALLPQVLKAPRSRSRSPLVQVLFNFLPSKPIGRMGQSGQGKEHAEVKGVPVSLGPGSSPPGNYDYIVEVIHLKNSAMLGIQYKTDLFEAATMEKLGQELVALFDHLRQEMNSSTRSMD
ncbi:condensation domain-containing protein [Streptomyces sp. NPDC059076]|uniref:condensation domain-containing protein n=1 Tax=unclassified Streptomyces TaxID=2593676 RepID=UPI0036A38E2C